MSLSLLSGGVVQNGPERSRGRRCWARRSEPLTARTVLRRSLKRERRERKLGEKWAAILVPLPAASNNNYCTHKKNDEWLAQFEGRVQFHFTPTSASWLNQIEIVFSLLQRKTLNGGSFKSKNELCDAIAAFIKRHNQKAKPFRWRKRDVKGSQLRNTIVNLCN